MSYGRRQTEGARLEQEIQQLLARAEATDVAEDQRYGAARRGDELPGELARRETRLAKLREAMAALEGEATAAAPAPPAPTARRRGRPSKRPPGTPAPTAQGNVTDPESRSMQNADKAFVQAYTAQAAVERSHQIVVACTVTNHASDAPHAVSLVTVEPFIATAKGKHGDPPPPPPRGRIPLALSPKDRMRRKLRTKRGHALYALRKAIIEPVFGLIKRARGFRQFLLRGLAKVQAE